MANTSVFYQRPISGEVHYLRPKDWIKQLLKIVKNPASDDRIVSFDPLSAVVISQFLHRGGVTGFTVVAPNEELLTHCTSCDELTYSGYCQHLGCDAYGHSVDCAIATNGWVDCVTLPKCSCDAEAFYDQLNLPEIG